MKQKKQKLLLLLALFLIVRLAHSQSTENPFAWDLVSDIAGGPVAYGNGQFIAFGYSGSLDASGTFASPTGEPGSWTWTGPGPDIGTPSAVAYANGLFVGVGYGIATSPDGTNWTTVYLGVTSSLSAVIHARGLFVAVGGSPEGEGPGPAILLTSPDGTHWTPRRSEFSGDLTSAAYGNGVFAAVGLEWFTLHWVPDEGYADLISSDGISWASHPDAEAPALNGIAFGGGLFVEIAGNGILASANGTVNFKDQPYIGSGNFAGAAYGDGWFVAVGDSIVVSTNGRAWSNSSYDLPSTASFSSVSFLNGVFMASSDSGILRGRLNVAPQHTPPAILTAPRDRSVNAGESASFSVTASGSSPLHYQWQFDGTNLAGQTNATLTIPYALPANSGNYIAEVSNGYGTTASGPAFLDVQLREDPTILQEPPGARMVQAGSNPQFAVLAIGGSPLTYQWRFNGANLPGATSSALVLTNVAESQGGIYTVLISDYAGAASSDGTFLTVSTLPKTLSTEYWPMYDGDVKWFSGLEGLASVQCIADTNEGQGDFLVSIYMGSTNFPWVTFGLSYGPASESVFNYSGKPEVGDTFDFNPPMTWFSEQQLRNGGTIRSTCVASIYDYTNISTSGVVTVSDAGAVTVPAGTFQNCRKVSLGGGGAIRGMLDEAIVLAPGVGPIQIGIYTGTPSGAPRFLGWESLTGGDVGGVDVRALAGGNTPPPTTLAPLSVNLAGPGTVRPNYDGQSLQLGKTYTMTARAAKGCKFVGWTGSGDSSSPKLTFTMESGLSFTANFADVSRPVLAIVYPKARKTVTSAALTATGKSSDNVGVAAVYYQLNSGGWTLADGTGTWSALGLVLTPGANVIRAYAVDIAGNTSATNTVSFTYLVSAPLSVTVSPPSGGTVTPKYNGQSLQVGKAYSMTAKPAKGFSFGNWTGSAANTSPRLTFVMASNLTFTANFKDTQRPVLTVLYPKARQAITTSALMATGKASDNAGVDAVYYQLNRGPWALAQGTTAWSAPNLDLMPGANVIRAYAVDAAGNASATNSVSFTYLVSAPLSVTVSPSGGGTVTPNYNGHLLQIGKSYSMTAKPAKGFSFVNWSGSAAGSFPRLTFVMASNLTFTANFRERQPPAQTYTYATLYSFGSVPHDGEHPAGSLTAVGSTLYGVTSTGGAYGQGTIFAISTDGSGYTNLYSFGTNAEDGGPSGTLTFVGGKLYGATRNGGNNGAGTIFSINTDGTGYTNIYGAFSGEFPGASSPNSLVSDGSTLYGTSQGGNFYASCPQYPGQVGNPFGTILSIRLDGSAYNTLYDFGSLFGCQDAAYPADRLILAGSTLYGMSPEGGDGANWYGAGGIIGSGTIFSIRTDGSGYTILHNFGLGSDGVWPYGGLALVGSTLYGSTWTGGSESDGTIFAIDTDGGNYHIIHNYQYANADFAPSGLTPVGFKVYGTVAAYSVALYNGTIFSVNTDGSDYTILHKFGAGSKDGAHPEAALSLLGSTLYGTAYAGGKNGKGTVFSLSLAGGTSASAGPSIAKQPLTLALPKLSISVSGDDVIVTWPGGAAGYALQSTTSLLEPEWASILTEPTSVNGMNTVTNPLSSGKRFYRLRRAQ